MSVQDLTAFIAKLEVDAGLQVKAKALQGLPESERLSGLCSLAAEEGLSVDPEDWAAEALAPSAADLDDEALRAVAGGGGCGETAGAYGAEGGSAGLALGGNCSGIR